MRDHYISRLPGAASRVLDGETIIMHPEESTFFTLNSVGTAIWRGADGRSTLREIVNAEVCREFEIDEATALADAEQFAAALSSHGILRVSPAPVE